MNTKKFFSDPLSSSSLEELTDMLNMVKSEIAKREPAPDDLVGYIADFCSDDVLLECLWAECESLKLGNGKRKVASQWISPSIDPYVYPDTDPVHHAKDIKEFPAITKLLSFVNSSDMVEGPLDSCLVLKYPSPSASLSLHADNEPTIDQKKAIATFSLGSSRTLEFYNTASRPKCVKDVRMASGSLVVMKPGTQQKLKHCIRAEKTADNSDSPAHVRFSLSFRALTKVETPTGYAGNITSRSVVTDSTVDSSCKEAPKIKKRICLIAGDSYAARLDEVRLGKNRINVQNIAVGGSRLKHTEEQLVSFFEKEGENVKVDKLIISVGTNDIRYCKQGVGHLKAPENYVIQ